LPRVSQSPSDTIKSPPAASSCIALDALHLHSLRVQGYFHH
jgi:hypothetical protein